MVGWGMVGVVGRYWGSVLGGVRGFVCCDFGWFVHVKEGIWITVLEYYDKDFFNKF